MFGCGLLTSFFSPNYRYEDSILTFCHFGLGLIPVFFKLNPKIFKVSAYLVIAFFFFQIFNGVLPDVVFPRTSRNFISVVLLVSCSYHIISCVQNKIQPSFLIVILSFVISIYGIGRGGIISFLLLMTFFPFSLKIKFKFKVIIVVTFLLLCIFGYLIFQNLLNETVFERFDSMGIESERNSINSDYILVVIQEAKSILFGADLAKIPSIVAQELNPHNSFIRLHIYYGIFGFFTLIGFLVYAYWFFYTKKHYMYMLLLSVLLLRSFLDSAAFHGPFDPLLFYLIYFSIQNKKLT
jgi:hypothetical protein